MRDQAITLLSAVLRHIRVLIDTVPQPEESLEAIYEWVEDWDQTWAGIYSWWKYVDKNKISILKVHDANLCDMTEESTIWQNKVIPVAIAIADLWQPEGQHRFNIDDLFEDYQEWCMSLYLFLQWVEERTWLEAERLAKAPSMHTWGQAARGEGQEHAPEDTEGHLSRGAAHLTGEGSGSTSKGKGKQKATSEEDELADDINDDKGDGEPGPSTKGPHAGGDNEPCETCAQANLACIGEPEVSCKWCRKPLPVPVDDPQASLLIDELQVEIKPFFVTATSLLDKPGDIEVMAQSDTLLAVEILEVKYPRKQLTANIVKHLQVLEARAKDEEFKLEQVYRLLEMLARQVTHQIKTAQCESKCGNLV
ncbi:hypothetical protein M404DRAFT_34533 [Pisolithus tinctorius Marx 270]|uniref:Uncharacterized protein n=1 Tax=Pisolithus tinctorius Marx 270 TaxID=870435 RepID=A0A0C3N1Q9_PISTI|nr:hypothetical protein M404DRAFT_34533 [Pisolithus tinctorius Marx 270]